MSKMGWSTATIVWICIPILLLAVAVCRLQRHKNPVISDREANKYSPGCFKVGGDCK